MPHNEPVTTSPAFFFKLLLYKNRAPGIDRSNFYAIADEASNIAQRDVEAIIAHFVREMVSASLPTIGFPDRKLPRRFILPVPANAGDDIVDKLKRVVREVCASVDGLRLSDVHIIPEAEAIAHFILQQASSSDGVSLNIGDAFTVVDAGGATFVCLPLDYCPIISADF